MSNQADGSLADRRLTTPRAASVAGIIFAVLYGTSLVLIRLSIPSDLMERGVWIEDQAATITFAINLLPFAGIAFLWFMGVVRDRLGAYEDQFMSTVFLGSGLIFMAMTFAAAAVGISTILTASQGSSGPEANNLYFFQRTLMYQFAGVYALRMAGVFMISVGTIWLRTQLMPRWFVILTYMLALALILIVNFTLWAQIVFPVWVFSASVYFMVRSASHLH